jgi:hypothetical protein
VGDVAAWSSVLGVEVAAPTAEAMNRVFAGAEMGPAFCDAFVAVSLELVEVRVNEALQMATIRVCLCLTVQEVETHILAPCADVGACLLAP